MAETAVQEWDIEVSGIELIAITENSVFRIDTASGEAFVLRIHRPGYHNLDELNSEQDWTFALNQAGVPVPKPRKTRHGRGYVTVSVPGTSDSRHAGMVEWIDGVPLAGIIDLEEDMSITDRFRQIGCIAAAIHNQAVRWATPTGFQRHAFDAEGLMGESPFWGPFWQVSQIKPSELKQILKARGAICRSLSEYGKDHGTYSMIHADLHPNNLIADGVHLYAIDFDDSGFGFHQYELAVALYGYQHKPQYEERRDALITGYRSEREISDAALERLPMFLLIRSLALVGWIDDRPELNQSDRQRSLIELACEQSAALFG